MREFTENILLKNGDGDPTILISADEKSLTIQTPDGKVLVKLGRSGHGDDGDIFVSDKDGNHTIHLGGEDSRLSLGGHGNDGDIFVRDKDGNNTIHLDGNGGDLILRQHAEFSDMSDPETGKPVTLDDIRANPDRFGIDPLEIRDREALVESLRDQVFGTQVMKLGGDGHIELGGGGTYGEMTLKDSWNNQIGYLGGKDSKLTLGGHGNDGDIFINNNSGERTIHLGGEDARLNLGGHGNDGDIFVNNKDGQQTVHLGGDNAQLALGGHGNDGDIFINDKNGDRAIHLDGNAGDIVLQNADCAEEFPVASMEDAEPGTVMVIEEAGSLTPCVEAGDSRVIGVISGAGGYRPAIVMGRDPAVDKSVPIATVGKVFCKATAEEMPIRTGDLLTTSSVPGHAKRLPDSNGSIGAVLGKALKPLESGRNLIPILVMVR